MANGSPQRIRHVRKQHFRGEEVWLVGDHRSTGERKYHRSNLPVDAAPGGWPVSSRPARSGSNTVNRKDQIGLDQFEWKSWQGVHRYALVSKIVSPVLQTCRLKGEGRRQQHDPAVPAGSACNGKGNNDAGQPNVPTDIPLTS